jgi:hypothetical protein
VLTKTALRACVSPVVAFTFAMVSITGVFMVIGIDIVEELHKGMGIAFVAIGAMHLAINWQARMGRSDTTRLFSVVDRN